MTKEEINKLLNPDPYWYVVMVVHPNLGSFEYISTATKLKKNRNGGFKRPKKLKYIYVDSEGNEYQEEQIICGMWDIDGTNFWEKDTNIYKLQEIENKYRKTFVIEARKEFQKALKVCVVNLPDFNSTTKKQWVSNLQIFNNKNND